MPQHSGVHESLGAHLRARCRLMAPEVAGFFARLPMLAECSPPILLFMQGTMALDRLHRALIVHGAVSRLGVARECVERRLAAMEFDVEKAWHALREIYRLEIPAHFLVYMEPGERILAHAKEGRIIQEAEVRGALNLMLNYADELHARLAVKRQGSPLKSAPADGTLTGLEAGRVLEAVGL